MPLVGSGMGNAIKAKIIEGQATPPNSADLDPFCAAIGEAIVEYLTANGLVIIPASAIATTGGPASQVGPAAPVPLSIT